MLPYNSERLTPVERAVQVMQTPRKCSSCRHQVRYARSGFRGCEEGFDSQAVQRGMVRCAGWEER